MQRSSLVSGRVLVSVLVIASAVIATAVVGAARSGSASRPVRQTPQAVGSLAQLVSMLGVLRQRQTEDDLEPALARMVELQSRNLVDLGLVGTPAISLVRLATVAPWGQHIFLIPEIPPTRQAIAKLPRQLRGVTVNTTVYVVSYPIGADGTAAQIAAGRDLGTGPDNRVVMVVPDGVATIALWPSGTGADEGHLPVKASVHNNVAAFRSPVDLSAPGREIWYAKSGKIIKRIADASSCKPPLGSCA